MERRGPQPPISGMPVTYILLVGFSEHRAYRLDVGGSEEAQRHLGTDQRTSKS